MPDPTRARGARSRANLKKGGSPGRPKETPADKEVKRISKKLLLRPGYQKTLKQKLDDGTLHPSVQVMLWYFAFGRPKEVVETKDITPVRIVHDYHDEK